MSSRRAGRQISPTSTIADLLILTDGTISTEERFMGRKGFRDSGVAPDRIAGDPNRLNK